MSSPSITDQTPNRPTSTTPAEHAATRWTSGRLTTPPQHTLHIHAMSLDLTPAQAVHAAQVKT